MNAQGISYLWQGFKRLCGKCITLFGDGCRFLLDKLYKLLQTILQFLGLVKKEETCDVETHFMTKEEKDRYE